MLNAYLPLTVIVFVINVKWFTEAANIVCHHSSFAAAGDRSEDLATLDHNHR